MNPYKTFIAKLVFTLLFAVFLHLTAWPQTCTTGKVDDRVAAFLKRSGPEKTLDQLKTTPIAQLKNEGPREFKKLPGDSVKRITITKDNIKVNVVKASAKSGLPVIINYHPGRFIMPLLPWMEYEAMRLAKKFNAVVFDVDYRVAPEHKFPAASNDAYNAYLWVLEHAGEHGGDPNRIILNGSSAGANLAALITHRAKKEGKHQPIKLVIMNCPPTDNPMISYYPSYEENAKGYMATKDQSIFYVQTYLDKSEWYKNNPEVWPIYEKDFTGLPPTLIIVTEFDVLRDEGTAYGKKLEKAGNDVSIKCFPHQLHCFIGLPQESGEIKRVYELMGEAIVKAVGK
jgi:acetyl esterase